MPETVLPETVEFHPLTFVPERDGVMVGRLDTQSYAVLPADGAQLLKRLTEGMPLAEAPGWYQSTYGERVDLPDFLETLGELGFLKSAGEQAAQAPQVRYQALGRALFSAVAWVCYAAVVAAALVALARYPQLRPHSSVIFFSSSLIVVQVVLYTLQMPAVGLHEWFHVMAGRRLGLPTQLGVSRRYYFFVFETNLNGLLGVPKSKRYLPFLAGLVADAVLFSALTLVAAADPHAPGWPARVALALAYTVLIRIIWQALLFLRTDLYYVLTTAVGCTSLAEASSAYLRRRTARLRALPGVALLDRSRAPDLGDEAWSPRDQALAPWFALLCVVGGTAIILALASSLIPVMVTFAERLVSGLTSGGLGTVKFWDAAVSATILVVQAFVLPMLAGRRSRRSAQPSAPEEVAV